MFRNYYVECIDDGVIISKNHRLHGYENENGKTVTFSCDRCADALRLAELVLDGQRVMQKSYVDMVVDVHEISYINKCHITDGEEEH